MDKRGPSLCPNVSPELSPLRDSLFKPSDDEAWKNWVDGDEFAQRHLKEILANPDIADGFKARALAVALWRGDTTEPVYFRFNSGIVPLRYNNGVMPLEGLSLPLLRFVVARIKKDQPNVRGFLAESGVRTCTNITDDVQILANYNRYILMLLRLLPPVEAEEIYPFYCFDGPGRAGGYRQFQPNEQFIKLLRALIDITWKIRADEEYRHRATFSLANYVDAIRLSTNVALSPEIPEDELHFLAQQLSFVLDHTGVSDIQWDHAFIYGILVNFGGVLVDIRHRFSKAILDTDSVSAFTVGDVESLHIATLLLMDLIRSPDHVQKLKQMIAAFECERTNKKTTAEAEQQRHDALLAAMMKK